MQAAYGKAQDRVYFLFGQLSEAALRNGDHDLAVADRFQQIGIGLLGMVFGLVVTVMLYIARRLTIDVVRPVELLRARSPWLSCGVLFVDIDDFKLVNDSVGHAGGDALLTSVAERLPASVRPADFVARLGGDEFAIITMGSPTGAKSAGQVAERILEAFAEPSVIVGRAISVTVSIGISGTRAETLDPGSLLSEADDAMYNAKHAGKGCRMVFEPAVSSTLEAA